MYLVDWKGFEGKAKDTIENADDTEDKECTFDVGELKEPLRQRGKYEGANARSADG